MILYNLSQLFGVFAPDREFSKLIFGVWHAYFLNHSQDANIFLVVALLLTFIPAIIQAQPVPEKPNPYEIINRGVVANKSKLK